MAIVIFMLPILSDTAWVKESLIEQLEEMVGGPIQIATMNLHLLPIPKIYLEDVLVQTLEPDAVTFRANLVEVAIGWSSFWDENVSISRIILDQPELTVEFPLAPTPEEPLRWQFPAIQQLVFRNGQLHLLQKFSSQTTQALHWEMIQLTVTQAEEEGPSLIRLSARIPNSQFSSALTLTGRLTALESNDTSPSTEEFPVIPPIHIQGQIEGSHLNLGQFVEFANGQRLKPPIHTEANVQGNFSFTIQEDTDTLTMEDFHFSLDDWSFVGQGSLEDVFLDSTRLNISGSSSPVALERLSSLLPHDWIPADVQTVLLEHQVVGTLELERGSFHIPFNKNAASDAEGIIRVKGGQFLPGPDQPLLTGISGSIAFSPSTLQFSQVRGYIAPLIMIVPEATMKLEEDATQLSVPSIQISEGDWALNGNVEFSHQLNSPPVLVVSASSRPISIQHFSTILPKPWLPPAVQNILTELDIDGDMELLTGSVKWMGDEANTLLPEGVFRIAKGTIQVDPNHPPLTNVSGGIVLGSDLFRFLDVEASIADSKIAVKEATLERKDSEYWIDLKGKGLFSANDVRQALLQDPRTQTVLPQLALYHNAQGNIQIALGIHGPLNNPEEFQISEGHLLLDDIHLFSTKNELPLRQLNGELTFDNQGLSIQRFKGQFGDSPIDIKGQWSFGKNSQSSNVTIAGTLSSTDLRAFFPAIRENFSTFDGPIETALSFSGSTLLPKYQATFDFTNTALTAKDFFHKPLGIPATIELKGSIYEDTSTRLAKGKLSIPPYTLEAQGRLSWSDPPYIRALVQTESGTGSLFPEGVIIGDGRLRLSSLGIIWGLEGKSWDWTTWAMQGKIEGSNRNAQTTTSNSNEDVQLASIQWAQKNQKGKGEVTLKKIPIESLLGSQPGVPPPLTGTTSLTASLHMDLDSPEQMQRSLTGKGNMQLQKGLIQTGPVLSKILGILNVPSLLMGKVNLLEEGLPYDELSGSFSIEKGLLTTEDLALKSPVIKLTAAGTYDFPTDILENKIAVSPFGAYSNLLKDIPLFGSLMKGERKGIMTALFDVKGPRTNPEVTYQPMESFTGGLKGLAQFPIDVLTNMIPLPLSQKETTQSVPLAK